MRYYKPTFINPDLLQDQDISPERLLEDEAAAMAFLMYLSENIVHQGFVVAVSGDKNTEIQKMGHVRTYNGRIYTHQIGIYH